MQTRCLRGHTFTENVIARQLDVHPSLLSHLLNGSIPIRENDPRVLRLAQALGVPAEEAFVTRPADESARAVAS